MLNIISNENIVKINETSKALIDLLKEEKFFIKTSFQDNNIRIKGTSTLLEISRAISDDINNRFTSLVSPSEESNDKIAFLVSELSKLVDNKPVNMCHKLKDLAGDIKPKLCRELVSSLEDMLIMGEITSADIDEVYEALNKPIPKKFNRLSLDDRAQEIYISIKRAIADKAEPIKARCVEHYAEMVKRIDPSNEIEDKALFVKECRKCVSDISTLALCVAYKFSNDDFFEMVSESFNSLVMSAASAIDDKITDKERAVDVKIESISVGGKGFDLTCQINDSSYHARAIPVEGPYVRFHYRYIVT